MQTRKQALYYPARDNDGLDPCGSRSGNRKTDQNGTHFLEGECFEVPVYWDMGQNSVKSIVCETLSSCEVSSVTLTLLEQELCP